MSNLVVTGFASLDYPVRLAGKAAGDRTTLITERDPQSWPRLGGCPAYVASEVARHELQAAPISWVGTDDEGDTYCNALHEAGCDVSGVARIASVRSPVAVLAYQADGACVCLYDPAFSGQEVLTEPQLDLLRNAAHVCVTVGPPLLVPEILAARNPAATLYWVLKHDPACFPPAICQELSRAQASVIFCSRSERPMIRDVGEDTIIVETAGTEGVTLYHSGDQQTCQVEPLEVFDTTGAGDTLAGGFIAARMQGETDPMRATHQGIRSVRCLLQRRAEAERKRA